MIDIATIKITRIIGLMWEMNGRESEARRMEAIKFIWIPGIKPVRVPAKTPRRMANISSRTISYLQNFYFRILKIIIEPY